MVMRTRKNTIASSAETVTNVHGDRFHQEPRRPALSEHQRAEGTTHHPDHRGSTTGNLIATVVACPV
jgi:hypothetical protein